MSMCGYPIVTTAQILEFIREHGGTVHVSEIYDRFYGERKDEFSYICHKIGSKCAALRRQGYLEHPTKNLWRAV